jgi:hypothetical protein
MVQPQANAMAPAWQGLRGLASGETAAHGLRQSNLHSAPTTTPMNSKEKQELMAKMVAKLGQEKAFEVVMAAYNTELLSNRLGRMEAATGLPGTRSSKDLLLLALQRTVEVLSIMP